MAQNFTENCFAAGNPGLTDLQNMENNFLCLKSLFSGSSAPADSTGGMPWFDSGNKILRIRDSTNGAWLGVHYSGSASRWWVYSNAANDGWIVDSSITDRVCAIKGGSQAYSTSGGVVAGTWTISGLTLPTTAHNHRWIVSNSSATGGLFSFDSAGTQTLLDGIPKATTASTNVAIVCSSYTGANPQITFSTVYYTNNATVTGSIDSSATWRPSAAVGTLQYLAI